MSFLQEFDKEIKNLILFYREKGYPDVIVNAAVNKDANTQNVSIRLPESRTALREK